MRGNIKEHRAEEKMEKQRQKGIYQVIWVDSNGEMKAIHLLTARSSEDANKAMPNCPHQNWNKSVCRVDDDVVRSILDLMGWVGSHEINNLHVWLDYHDWSVPK